MCTSSRISDFSQTGIIRNQVDYIILPDCLTGAVDAGIECQHIGTRLLQVRDTEYRMYWSYEIPHTSRDAHTCIAQYPCRCCAVSFSLSVPFSVFNKLRRTVHVLTLNH